MNPFSTPTAEIQEAIDILQQARALSDPRERQEHAEQAIPALGQTRFGRKLAQVVGGLVEDDDLDRAIELLQKVTRGSEKTPNRSPRQVLLRVGLGLAIPLVAVSVFFAGSVAGGDRAEALRSLEQCRESQRALGTPIETRWSTFPPGGLDHNDNSELARRALPVKGSGGTGRYHYLAEKLGGAWTIRHGALEVGGQHLMVVPCGGAVSESDAEGRLRTGFRGTGSVRDVEGMAPVQSGEACTVEVHPDPDFPDSVTFNCRVVVTCGGQAIYGASSDTGYVFCSARDGIPAMAVDSTGSSAGRGADPMLRLNLPSNEVRVSDDTGWSFTIDLRGSR
jgi:hypothetical protein